MIRAFLLALCLSYTVAYAQVDSVTESGVFKVIKEELNRISTLKLPIKSVSYSPTSGQWLVLYSDFGYAFNVLPEKAKLKLLELNKASKEVDQFVFGEKDSWVLTYENNGYVSEGLPDELYSTLATINKGREELKWVGLGEKGSWVLLANRNSFVYKDIDVKLAKTLRKKAYKYENVRSLGFSVWSGPAWVLISDTNTYYFDGIPKLLKEQLENVFYKGQIINNVYFYPKGRWLIVYNQHDFICNF